MSNFEVGDRVVVVKNNHEKVIATNYNGSRGTVQLISDAEEYEVRVIMDETGGFRLFDSSELELEGVYDALSEKPAEEVSSFEVKVDSRSEDAMVKSPPHYTNHPSGIQPIEITRHHDFVTGNVLKYVMRAPYKGSEVQDLKKAAQYLQWAIEDAEGRA